MRPLARRARARAAALTLAAAGAARAAAARVGGGGGVADLPAARERLHRILARPEFHFARASLAEPWQVRVWKWLMKHLPHGSHLAPPVDIPVVLAWAFVALTLGLLVVLWLTTRGEALAARARLETAATRALTSAQWRARAREAAARGAFREAVHLAYWAAAQRLAERELVPLDRARTHRETLRRVPVDSDALAPFRALVMRFERVWFGRDAAGAEAWAEAERRLEEMGCSTASIASS